MRSLVIATAIAILSAAPPSMAREVLGTGFVNGKTVRLYDDGTWEFDNAAFPDTCSYIDDVVQLCDPDRVWKRSTGPNFGFDAIFFNTRDEDVYGAIGSQPYGSGNGNSVEGVIQHFVLGAAEIDGLAPEQIPVYGVEETTVAELPATRFTIGFPQQGLRQINVYSIVIGEGFSIYALTWAVGDEPTDRMSAAHADFTAKLAIDPEKAKE